MKDINKLVEKSKSQDKKAFEKLYTLTSKELYWYCRKLCDNDADANDLLQETYLKAWKKINNYTDVNFTAWLHSIAHNQWLDKIKNKKNELFLEDEFVELSEDESVSPTNQSERAMLHEKIMKIINNSLSELQKMTILMYYYDERSVGEIAKDLNLSETSIKVTLYRAREKLKAKLKNEDLFSLTLPLMLKHDAEKLNIPTSLNTIRKSIFKKISFSAVKVPCIAVTISTGMVIAGVTISELGLPTEHFENNDSIVVVTSVSESETTETTVTTSETTENVTNSDTVETTTFSVKESEIQQTVSTYHKRAVTTETVTEITESESTVDVLSSYYEDYERFISWIVEDGKSDGLAEKEIEKLLPVFSDIYVDCKGNPPNSKNEGTYLN